MAFTCTCAYKINEHIHIKCHLGSQYGMAVHTGSQLVYTLETIVVEIYNDSLQDGLGKFGNIFNGHQSNLIKLKRPNTLQ